ncbi:hypothetical protein M0R45_028892 [Rubus argutus]|uniref:Uncharacterized protein n=1 Tax=Rubus argutus TaxID=59490 RepID=A0AAW1W7E8_RUBAR
MEDHSVEKVAISGPALASMIQRFSTSRGAVDGLIFGHVSHIAPHTHRRRFLLLHSHRHRHRLLLLHLLPLLLLLLGPGRPARPSPPSPIPIPLPLPLRPTTRLVLRPPQDPSPTLVTRIRSLQLSLLQSQTLLPNPKPSGTHRRQSQTLPLPPLRFPNPRSDNPHPRVPGLPVP